MNKLLLKDEKVITKVHKHWLTFLGHALGPIFFAVIPIILLFLFGFFSSAGTLPTLSSTHLDWFAFLYSVWLLIAWIILFSVWTDYYLDVWLVTDRRIIDIEQRGLFHREVSSFRLDRIQDITVEIQGWLHTILKVGTIHVQTAGESREFIMKGVGNAEKLKEIIYNEHVRVIEDNSFVSPNT